MSNAAVDQRQALLRDTVHVPGCGRVRWEDLTREHVEAKADFVRERGGVPDLESIYARRPDLRPGTAVEDTQESIRRIQALFNDEADKAIRSGETLDSVEELWFAALDRYNQEYPGEPDDGFVSLGAYPVSSPKPRRIDFAELESQSKAMENRPSLRS